MRFLLLLVVLVVVVALVSRAVSQRGQREVEEQQLTDLRRSAEEDVTRLGEDVAALDAEVAGRQLDAGARQDYRRALDAYDQAKAALDAVRQPSDVRTVTEALEDGRYAVASVQARVEGRPLPTRRPPCFFNPQHGPSSRDVSWAPPGGQPRQVPVCEADAERVEAGADPDARKVLVGGQRRDYWAAGPGWAPYAQGYFSPYATSGLLPGVLLGAALGGAFGGWDGGGYDGGDPGSDGGGFDGGGWDGGDSGGFDGSGFDV